jgi:hypothetical protein
VVWYDVANSAAPRVHLWKCPDLEFGRFHVTIQHEPFQFRDRQQLRDQEGRTSHSIFWAVWGTGRSFLTLNAARECEDRQTTTQPSGG